MYFSLKQRKERKYDFKSLNFFTMHLAVHQSHTPLQANHNRIAIKFINIVTFNKPVP